MSKYEKDSVCGGEIMPNMKHVSSLCGIVLLLILAINIFTNFTQQNDMKVLVTVLFATWFVVWGLHTERYA